MLFNFRRDRPGASFLESILENIAKQLEAHKSEESSRTFFDTVIFCTHVTYADGSRKRGSSFSSLPLPQKVP